jgi:uncharacterized protein
MLRRKVYSRLLEWKNSADCSLGNKKCLVIKGARQVGKTYTIRAFGKAEYESYIEINFLRQPELKSIFDGSLSGEEIYKRMTASIPGIQLIPGETLVFLDEIQKCAAARTALKFLAEDGRYDVIASGSLLGLSYGRDDDEDVEQVQSIPVGYEIPIMMYSLDFEEFLWANGYSEEAIKYLRECYDQRKAVPENIHQKYEMLVREFIVVGGMPEVVADFTEHKDFGRVQDIQSRLLSDYEDDIAQHAKGAEKAKVRRCYDSIPNQLARENKKFKYSEVEKKSTSKKYGDSIQWLADANMALLCRNVMLPQLPLRYNEKENEFKLYINDTGLLMSLFGFNTKLAVLNNTLTGFAKGGIYENFVAESLVKNGYQLHYYKPDDENELEFVIEKQGEVLPIEVKAGNTATKSLNRYIEKYRPSVAYKIMNGNIGEIDGKLSIPHYMVMFL